MYVFPCVQVYVSSTWKPPLSVSIFYQPPCLRLKTWSFILNTWRPKTREYSMSQKMYPTQNFQDLKTKTSSRQEKTIQPRTHVVNSRSWAIESLNPGYLQYFVTFSSFFSKIIWVSQHTTKNTQSRGSNLKYFPVPQSCFKQKLTRWADSRDAAQTPEFPWWHSRDTLNCLLLAPCNNAQCTR